MKVKERYYENGQIRWSWPIKNGEYNGMCRGWYKDGKLWYEWPCRNGRWYGLRREWDLHGKLIVKQYHLYDKKVSEEEFRRHELTIQLAGIKDG